MASKEVHQLKRFVMPLNVEDSEKIRKHVKALLDRYLGKDKGSVNSTTKNQDGSKRDREHKSR